MNQKEAASGYMVQIDGLRAIAVLVVILFHWTPEVKQLGLGGLGVQLFFVLSGYLITGILVKARGKAEKLGVGKWQIIKSFYARRFLRIFPLYYLIVLLTYLLGAYNVKQYLYWHLGYFTNIVIFLRGNWIGEASHLWSLAVEEQFYLLWPFVILFTPRRHLISIIIGFILLAPLFKLSFAYLEIEASRLGVLPVSSFHYLGAGALLAVLEIRIKTDERNQLNVKFPEIIQYLGIAGLLVFCLLQAFPYLLTFSPMVSVVQEFALTGLFVSLTLGAANGFKGIGGKILAAKPMIYIGKISYGLYLIHNFVPYFTSKYLHYFGLSATKHLGAFGMLIFHTFILMAVSSFFWHFFEKHLNSLKHLFPYVAKDNTFKASLSKPR